MPQEQIINQEPLPRRSQHQLVPQPIGRRLARGFAGAALAGGAAFASCYAITHDGSPFDPRIDFGVSSEAQPSDDLARLFDGIVDGSAVLGGLVLAGVGARNVRAALSPQRDAIRQIAYQGRPGGRARKTVAVSALPVFSAMTFGFSANIGDAVGGSQLDALRPLVRDIPESSVLLSNSGKPELATTPILSNELVHRLFQAKELGDYTGIDLIPLRYSWESAVRGKDLSADSSTKAKILTVVMSLPPELTGLPETGSDCELVPVNAAPALGDIGDTIHMAGKTFKIAGHLDGSGPNVVPIAMNNDAYAQCFAANAEQPYNLVAVRGDDETVNKFLEDAGVQDAKSEIKTSTLKDFMEETDRTSKNNSNGLILIFAAAASIAAAGALVHKTRADFANNRAVNSMLSAGGLSNKAINKIAQQRSDREAILASLYAMPLIAGMDWSTALSTPGATNVAPNVLTYFTVLGVSTAIGRAATATIAPSEIHKLNPARRGTQQ